MVKGQQPKKIDSGRMLVKIVKRCMCHFTEVCGNGKHHMKPYSLSLIKTTQNSVSLAPIGLKLSKSPSLDPAHPGLSNNIKSMPKLPYNI
jgi:hypothetical protein